MADLSELRRLLALACRVLAHEGLVENVLGHVSVRVGSEHLLVRCRGPHERGLLFTVTDDLQLVDLEGNGDLGAGYAVPSELPIHTEILRCRPDVDAVVHAHPPAVLVAGITGLPLRPIFGAYNIPAARMGAAGVPVYPRSVLIRRRDLAEEMLAAMGQSPVCVLRGHGITAVGTGIEQAVMRALDLDALARVTLAAAGTGRAVLDVPSDDLAELPDLGSGFNDTTRWRHCLARLEHVGLGLRE